MARRFSEALRAYSAALSKGGAALITAMATFVVWKYFNTAGTNPFKEHGVILSILIAAILVHLIFGFLMKNSIHLLILSFCIWLVSGFVAIELILFILFSQIWKLLVINASVALLVAMVWLFNNLSSFFSVPQEAAAPGGDIEIGDVDQPAAPGGDIEIGDVDQPECLNLQGFFEVL